MVVTMKNLCNFYNRICIKLYKDAEMVISWPAIVPRLCLNDFKMTNIGRKD